MAPAIRPLTISVIIYLSFQVQAPRELSNICSILAVTSIYGFDVRIKTWAARRLWRGCLLSNGRPPAVREGRDTVKKADRRVERTQRLLREALFSLILEKGFEALTVQEIIERADVGRATFYAHFDNKEDLLVSGLDRLLESLKGRQREALARGGGVDQMVFAFSRDLFAHAEEHRELFRAMVGKESGAAIQRLWHKMLLDLVRQDVKVAAKRGDLSSVNTE